MMDVHTPAILVANLVLAVWLTSQALTDITQLCIYLSCCLLGDQFSVAPRIGDIAAWFFALVQTLDVKALVELLLNSASSFVSSLVDILFEHWLVALMTISVIACFFALMTNHRLKLEERQHSLEDYSRHLQNILPRIHFLEKNTSFLCDEINIREKELRTIRPELKAAKDQAESDSNLREEAQSQNRATLALLQTKEQDERSLRNNIAKLESDITGHTNTIDGLKQEIAQLRQTLEGKSKEDHEMKIKALEQQLAETEKTRDNYRNKISVLEQSLEAEMKEKQSRDSTEARLENEREEAIKAKIELQKELLWAKFSSGREVRARKEAERKVEIYESNLQEEKKKTESNLSLIAELKATLQAERDAREKDRKAFNEAFERERKAKEPVVTTHLATLQTLQQQLDVERRTNAGLDSQLREVMQSREVEVRKVAELQEFQQKTQREVTDLQQKVREEQVAKEEAERKVAELQQTHKTVVETLTASFRNDFAVCGNEIARLNSLLNQQQQPQQQEQERPQQQVQPQQHTQQEQSSFTLSEFSSNPTPSSSRTGRKRKMEDNETELPAKRKGQLRRKKEQKPKEEVKEEPKTVDPLDALRFDLEKDDVKEEKQNEVKEDVKPVDPLDALRFDLEKDEVKEVEEKPAPPKRRIQLKLVGSFADKIESERKSNPTTPNSPITTTPLSKPTVHQTITTTTNTTNFADSKTNTKASPLSKPTVHQTTTTTTKTTEFANSKAYTQAPPLKKPTVHQTTTTTTNTAAPTKFVDPLDEIFGDSTTTAPATPLPKPTIYQTTTTTTNTGPPPRRSALPFKLPGSTGALKSYRL